MFDELFDRAYQSGRNALNLDLDHGLRHLLQAVDTTFCALARIQFDAPWARRQRNAHCG